MRNRHRNEDDVIDGVPFAMYDWTYYKGPSGLGGYTIKADKNGWYYSFWCKPVGPGARAGQANKFKYVERTLSKRRRRKSAEERSYNLSQGKPVSAGIKPKSKSRNPSGAGYCMREKKRVIMTDLRQVTAKNGRIMIQGQCPSCGLLIHKYGKLALCPECDRIQEMAANDYICKECRGDGD